MASFSHMTVELSPEVLFQEVEGEAVLLDLASGQYFGLNEVGMQFWIAARDSSEMDVIFARILEQFEVDADILERDLTEFLEQMTDAGLVSLSAQEPPP
jgi:hypothetical protein